MTEKERFTVDSDGKYWDKINHRYVNLDYLFRLVEELDTKLDNKQHTINEIVKTIRIYDDAYIDLNKKYKEVVDENEQLKGEIKRLKCINKQLEERLDKDIALNMDCGEVDCPTSCSSCKYYRANDNYCYYFNNSV